jgi:hypothetical protein
MTHDKATLHNILDYCRRKWVESDHRISIMSGQDADIQIGKKMAYNDVLQHARKLLDEAA